MSKILGILKAVTGAIVTGLGALQVAYSDNVLTTQEIIYVVTATVIAFGAVWAVPNATKSSTPPAQ